MRNKISKNEQEHIFIRKLAKVIGEDEKSRYFWFSYQHFIELYAKLDFDYEKLKAKYELAETDLDKAFPDKRTIARVMGYFRGEKMSEEKKGKRYVRDMPIELRTAKALGMALCDGDPYGLLLEIETTNILKITEEANELWGARDLDHIYGMMNNILYDLEPSSYYWYIPGTEEDAYQYYDMRLQSIRHEIDVRFRGKNEERSKLYTLVEELEQQVKSCSHPGACERWVRANKRLRYFDCVYAFVEANPELYESIQNGEIHMENGNTISFNFYPTEQECKERKEYFDEMFAKSQKLNIKFSEERLYQNELIEAFRTVFEADFS